MWNWGITPWQCLLPLFYTSMLGLPAPAAAGDPCTLLPPPCKADSWRQKAAGCAHKTQLPSNFRTALPKLLSTKAMIWNIAFVDSQLFTKCSSVYTLWMTLLCGYLIFLFCYLKHDTLWRFGTWTILTDFCADSGMSGNGCCSASYS